MAKVKVIRDFGEFKAGDEIEHFTDEQVTSHVKSGDIEVIDGEKSVDE